MGRIWPPVCNRVIGFLVARHWASQAQLALLFSMLTESRRWTYSFSNIHPNIVSFTHAESLADWVFYARSVEPPKALPFYSAIDSRSQLQLAVFPCLFIRPTLPSI